MTAWLRWKLLDDVDAARLFVGDDCLLCKDERWQVKNR
jgi:hypothetical protein